LRDTIITRLVSPQILRHLLCGLAGDLASFEPEEYFYPRWDVTESHDHDRFQASVCQTWGRLHVLLRLTT